MFSNPEARRSPHRIRNGYPGWLGPFEHAVNGYDTNSTVFIKQIHRSFSIAIALWCRSCSRSPISLTILYQMEFFVHSVLFTRVCMVWIKSHVGIQMKISSKWFTRCVHFGKIIILSMHTIISVWICFALFHLPLAKDLTLAYWTVCTFTDEILGYVVSEAANNTPYSEVYFVLEIRWHINHVPIS